MTSLAAVRMRRLRARRARGGRIVAVEVDVDLLADLTELGLIGPNEADDPDALSFGLAMLLSEAVEARRKSPDFYDNQDSTADREREFERDHLDQETLTLAAAGAERTLGPDHSATRAFARAAATMAKVDLWRARLALRTLRRDQRQAIAEAAEAVSRQARDASRAAPKPW